MASVNKVTIVGNLGKEPELRQTSSGSSICNITVATSRKWKDKTTGDTQQEVEWHRVTFFERLAEIAGQYLKKGSPVYVEGRLKTRKYTDKDGVEKYATEIIATELQLLGGRDDGGPAMAPATAQAHAQRQATTKPAAKIGGCFVDMDNDIPFVLSLNDFDVPTSKAKRMARCAF